MQNRKVDIILKQSKLNCALSETHISNKTMKRGKKKMDITKVRIMREEKIPLYHKEKFLGTGIDLVLDLGVIIIIH